MHRKSRNKERVGKIWNAKKEARPWLEHNPPLALSKK